MIISVLSNKFFIFVLVRVLLILLLITLSLYQRKLSQIRYTFLTEQNKSFECGFDQFDKKYWGFCVQYINTAFLFLVVDLEIALLIPLFIYTPLYEKSYFLRFANMFLIVTTLLIILLIEVIIGGLKWREDL